jgi:transcriptional regulator with XRE-family HTH domain
LKSLYSQRYRYLLKLLVESRKVSGLSQQAVADKLKRNQSFVSKYESGERRLDVIELLMLSEVIGFDAIKMIGSLSVSSVGRGPRRMR